MRYLISITIMFSLFGCTSFKQITDLQKDKQFHPETGNYYLSQFNQSAKLNYIITFPSDFDERQKLPLILFLHSLEERGENLPLVLQNSSGQGKGLGQIALESKDFPFITVSPLCPKGTGWGFLHKKLFSLVQEIATQWNIDTTRIYLTGVSMGGMGTWSMSMAYPELFAAIAPISAGFYPPFMKTNPKDLTKLPIWAFHDLYDPSIPITKEIKTIIKLRELGGDIKYTISEEAKHYIHENIYMQRDLFDWFLSKKK